MFELLAYCSDPDSEALDPLAFHRFATACKVSYFKQINIPRWAKDTIWSYKARNVKQGEQIFCRLETIFRFAATHSVSVLDLLLRPEESASSTLVIEAKCKIPATIRRSIQVESMELLCTEAKTLLDDSSGKRLPSLRELGRKHGLKASGVWKKHSNLCSFYVAKRRAQESEARSIAWSRALDLAKRVIISNSRCDASPRKKQLAKVVMEQASVPKHIAERAVQAAIGSLAADSGVAGCLCR
jgi:hypothetical protein